MHHANPTLWRILSSVFGIQYSLLDLYDLQRTQIFKNTIFTTINVTLWPFQCLELSSFFDFTQKFSKFQKETCQANSRSF